MDLRYDYFGEFPSQNDESEARTRESIAPKSTPVVEDSLMEFISEYFRGDVPNDLSTTSMEQSNSTPELMAVDDPKSSSTNSFDISVVSSDVNTSSELFGSPDISMFNTTMDSLAMKDNSGGDRSTRRKSISYEIRFVNSKDENGKVKLCVLPNTSGSGSAPVKYAASIKVKTKTSDLFPSSVKGKTKELNDIENLRNENELLQQKVKVLERKLTCVEKESERVVGELKHIIERKNQAISKLELQLAGIDFIDGL